MSWATDDPPGDPRAAQPAAAAPPAEPATPAVRRRRRRWLAALVLGALVLALVAYLLHNAGSRDGFSLVDADLGNWAYVAVALLIFGDAVCPIFPGETTLNAASTLAAAGSLQLGWVIVAGAVGSIVGDSTLFGIARLARRRVEPQLERVRGDRRVASVFAIMGARAPLLIVAGRYVPGVRFAVNASYGVTDMPYRRFLPWSALGATLWSVYTCCLAYVVGTALSEFPLASVVISGAVTTAALAAIFLVVRRRPGVTLPDQEPRTTP
jgi:membrane-associated protein